MSAYQNRFIAQIPSKPPVLVTSALGAITPGSIDTYEPMVAGGELIFAGDGPDLVMQRVSSTPLTVDISLLY